MYNYNTSIKSLILTIVQLVEFKLKLEYTKGALSKVLVKG